VQVSEIFLSLALGFFHGKMDCAKEKAKGRTKSSSTLGLIHKMNQLIPRPPINDSKIAFGMS
jgi:hypothetical protein